MALGVNVRDFSSPKTIELIIYISSKLKDKPKYGSTILGKALCLIDSMSFLKKGTPITDLTYIKQDHGPIPNPSKFLPLREALVKNGDLEEIKVDYYGRTQHKFIAKREPNIEVFDRDEIFLIDEVVESLCDQNATEISDYTHNFISWIFANQKEELPFYTFLLTKADPTNEDYSWAKDVIDKYNSTMNAS